MTQDAIVTKLLPDGMAEVVVTRSTACGGNCGSCELCKFQSEIKTPARNLIDAKPGQRVVIMTKTSPLLGSALLTYAMPLVFFLLGYVLAAALGAKEEVRILASFAALAVSSGVLILIMRFRKPITFDIIG